MDVFTYIIMGLLSLDTIRAIIAMLGWVKPDSKLSWLIYGRYERNLIEKALKDIGFSSVKSRRITQNLKSISREVSNSTGVTSENAVEHLIVLLAKYIVKFDQPIQYGGSKTTDSSYYIDTMEISHSDEDRKKLSAIMVHLLNKKTTDSKKPQAIITPKGGNPLFAMEVAKHYNALFLMSKSKTDKSRIFSVKNNAEMDFMINYEGSWSAEDLPKGKCIVLDCNTSGGSQLLDIVKDLQKVTSNGSISIQVPKEVYVLFRADERHRDIDQKFSDHNCSIYRFFDLDEELKKAIYDLRMKYTENENVELDLYCKEVALDVKNIINEIRNKNKLYYS